MKFRALFLLLLLPVLAQATAPSTLHLHPLDRNQPSQTLAELQGDATVAILFRADCAPCRRELAALPRLARAHPQNRILLIDLDSPQMTENSLASISLPATVQPLRAEEDNAMVMDMLGDKKHALPYSVHLGANGAVCGGHTGFLGSKSQNPWSAAC